jgi:hypothetical protein
MITSVIAAALILGSSTGLLWFIATHNLKRHETAPGVDWGDGHAFTSLLIPYIITGCSASVFQSYLMWLCSSFSNEPTILSHYSGYIEALKALGLIVAFGIDSNQVSFLTEEAVYCSLSVIGIVFCIISAIRYTKDTKYVDEQFAIVPKAFWTDKRSTN